MSPEILQTIRIRPGQLEEIIDLRWRILRAGLDRQTAFFDGDAEPTTRHFVAIVEGRVVGCATILRRDWNDAPAWQLRGMAVEPDLQRCGIGRMLLEAAERTAAGEDHSRQLWCNARTPAVPFYEKLGWQRHGAEFTIPTAGPHYRMSKRLD